MTEQATRPAWMSDPDLIEDFFHDGVAAGNADQVDAAIRLMLGVDTRRGIALYDSLKTALAVRDVFDVVNGSASEAQLQSLLQRLTS